MSERLAFTAAGHLPWREIEARLTRLGLKRAARVALYDQRRAALPAGLSGPDRQEWILRDFQRVLDELAGATLP